MSAPVKKCEVTPLEALRRLYEVARKVDASEAGDFETLLQGELAVVEAVLRDAAMGKIIDQIADTWPMKKYTLEEIEDGLRALVANPANFAPSAAPVVPVAAQPVVLAPIDWKDRLYAAMDAGFALREGHERDEDGQRMGMVIDDTQVGVEFAMSWFEQNMLAAPSLEAQLAGEVERDAKRWRQMLLYVGADQSPAMGVQYFVFRGIHAKPGVNLMRGSVAEHFTDVIDAAMAQGEKQ